MSRMRRQRSLKHRETSKSKAAPKQLASPASNTGIASAKPAAASNESKTAIPLDEIRADEMAHRREQLTKWKAAVQAPLHDPVFWLLRRVLQWSSTVDNHLQTWLDAPLDDIDKSGGHMQQLMVWKQDYFEQEYQSLLQDIDVIKSMVDELEVIDPPFTDVLALCRLLALNGAA